MQFTTLIPSHQIRKIAPKKKKIISYTDVSISSICASPGIPDGEWSGQPEPRPAHDDRPGRYGGQYLQEATIDGAGIPPEGEG